MACQHLFHRTGRQAMPGNVDHVIGAGHDVEIAVLIDIARIAGFIKAGEMGEIALHEAGFGVPQGGQRAGGQRQADGDGAQRAGGHRVAALIQHLHVVARHGDGGRADLDRQGFDAHRIGGNGVAGFGLPPVVDHRHLHMALRPEDGIGVGAFAGQIDGLQVGQVIAADQQPFGIIALDGAQGRGRGEEAAHLMFGDHPPEGPGIRRADRLAFIDDRGASGDQRAIADIAVAHDPAHV